MRIREAMPSLISLQLFAEKLGRCLGAGEIFAELQMALEIPRRSLVVFHSCESPHPVLVDSPHDDQMAILAFIRAQDPLIAAVATSGAAQARSDRTESPSPLFPEELSALAVPLSAGGRVVGILYVGSRSVGAYGPGDLEEARAVGAVAAPFLALAWNEEELACGSTANRRDDAVSRLARGARRLAEGDPAEPEIVPGLAELFPHTGVSLVLEAQADGQRLKVTGIGAGVRPNLLGVEVAAAASPWLAALASGHSTAVTLAESHRAVSTLPFDDRFALLAPLLGPGGKRWGCLYVGAARAFQADEARLLDVYAGLACLALQRAESERRARDGVVELSDPSSEVLDSRVFALLIAEEFAWSPLPGALFRLTLDRLDQAVERFGPGASETVLRAAARALRREAGLGRTVARLGAEEWAVVARDVEPALALREAERYRAALRQALDAWELTVSVGLACYTGALGSYSETLNRAGEALARARAAGGNRAVSASP